MSKSKGRPQILGPFSIGPRRFQLQVITAEVGAPLVSDSVLLVLYERRPPLAAQRPASVITAICDGGAWPPQFHPSGQTSYSSNAVQAGASTPGLLTNRTKRLLLHFLFDGERYARLRIRIKLLLPAPQGQRNCAAWQHWFGHSQLDFEQSRDGPSNTTG